MGHMAYVLPNPRVITRESQIEVGKFYTIRGKIVHPDAEIHGIDTMTILPYQLIQPTTEIFRTGTLDIGTFKCRRWTHYGEWGAEFEKDVYIDLFDINIPEHGQHDIHLERASENFAEAFQQMCQDNMKQDYGEIVGYRKGERGF